MAEVTNELMYELLKSSQQEPSSVKTTVSELKREFNSMRGTMVSIQSDIHIMYGILDRHDERLERIEKRLDFNEMAEPTRPYDPRG